MIPETPRDPSPPSAFTLTGVHREFQGPSGKVAALDGIDLDIPTGQFVAVVGPSGCGKSTLLLTLGGMLRPSSGSVDHLGVPVYGPSASERTRWRAREIGFVFQLFHLLPYLDVRGNILTGQVPGSAPDAGEAGLDSLLQQLGLEHRSRHLPATLSAGERQRVALARALIKRPSIILADEPTGNLDPANAGEVLRHLGDFHRRGGTVIIVTHGLEAQTLAQRIVRMDQGRVIDDRAHTPGEPVPAQTSPASTPRSR